MTTGSSPTLRAHRDRGLAQGSRPARPSAHLPRRRRRGPATHVPGGGGAVRRLANALLARGVVKGDRIGIVATDCHGFIETLWASMRIGAVFVPLNVRLIDRELGDLFDHAGARVLFVSADQAHRAVRLAERVDSLPGILSYQPSGQPGVEPPPDPGRLTGAAWGPATVSLQLNCLSFMLRP